MLRDTCNCLPCSVITSPMQLCNQRWFISVAEQTTNPRTSQPKLWSYFISYELDIFKPRVPEKCLYAHARPMWRLAGGEKGGCGGGKRMHSIDCTRILPVTSRTLN